jgi:hypothetical protein
VTVPESRPKIAKEELDSLWVIVSQFNKIGLEERKAAGKEIVKSVRTEEMSGIKLKG